ncbi:hypothetical protein [Cellulomonas shaoxiangyii]|uniref:Tetratricopeptide repeat protein n=1 Tax=Cellulomonas shaoxiangyii TaxID=2566013 RepID=A0A4P7SJF4_9CELL|nr:hypothetical protein [Cellulomonas shaoxiangyii]QCB93828.1 hypothetical protein E5225_09905 [Cellulomonas shaoxiangyii]TGY84478.1 hypothetical protein E5226_11135 [Cellulomonas shaoxiangyii]
MATYRIDPDSLREVPRDVTAGWAHVEALEERGSDGDGERVAWLRILGALTSAELLAWADVARHGGPATLDALPTAAAALPRTAYRPLLRLAHVLHWQRRYGDADAVVDAVRCSARAAAEQATAAGDEPVRRDCAAVLGFADQQQGRVRYDEGRYPEAAALFAAALERRECEGAPADQVASSRQALAAARRRHAGVAPSRV